MGRILIFLIALFAAQSSHAAYLCPVTGIRPPSYTFNGAGNTHYNGCAIGSHQSPGAACAKTYNGSQSSYTYTDSPTELIGTCAENASTGKLTCSVGYKRTVSYPDGTSQVVDLGPQSFGFLPDCNCADGSQPIDGHCPGLCDDKAGQSVDALELPDGQTSGCMGGCEVNTGGVGVSVGGKTYWTDSAYSGSECSTGEQGGFGVPKTLTDGTDGACDPSGANCVSKTKTKCGYVNGEYRCVTSNNMGGTGEGCASTASGAVYCNGTGNEGQPSGAPDSTFHLDGGTTVYYYSYSTVRNDTNYGGDDNGNPESAKGNCGSNGVPCHVVVDSGQLDQVTTVVNIQNGDGTGDGDSSGGMCGGAGQPSCMIAGQCGGAGQPACVVEGLCGGAGEPECHILGQCGGDGQPKCDISGQCGGTDQPACKVTAVTCDGDCDFHAPDKDAAPAIGDSINTFYAAVKAAPLFAAADGIGSSISEGGTLPSASFQAFGQTFTYAVPAAVVDAISSILSAVMYAVWSLIAVRLFFQG